jgi:hypothetical protein
VLAGVGLLWAAVVMEPIHAGDGLEYHTILQAWDDHATPDLRPEDLPPLAEFRHANGLDKLPPESGFWLAPNGKLYCWHFWLYPLCALPVKFLLHACRANPQAALQVTNVLFFLGGLYVALFRHRVSAGKRLTLVGLAAVSPVVWYLRWPSPEVFTWTLVLLCLVCLNNKQYVLSALCAALAATQNPPVIFLAGYVAVLSWREHRQRREAWGQGRGVRMFLTRPVAIGTSAAAFLALGPTLFSYVVYGVANPIAAHGGTDVTLISWERTWSLLTDLEQGLLPYVPALLLLAGVAGLRILFTRNLAGLGMVAVLTSMILACQVTTLWISAAAGLMRYAVWMLPVLAWLVAQYVPLNRFGQGWVAAATALQALIVCQHDGRMNYLDHGPVAHFVLSKAPTLYNPVPEVFYVRQVHSHTIFGPHCLPLPFITNDYRVTKLLTDRQSIDKLADKFVTDPEYLAAVKASYQDKTGLFYLNPPKNAVRLRPGPSVAQLDRAISLAVPVSSMRASAPRVDLPVTIANSGPAPFLTEATTHPPLRIALAIYDAGGRLVQDGLRAALPDTLRAGESMSLAVPVALPRCKGEYACEVKPVLEGFAFGKRSVRLRVVVGDESPSTFQAQITAIP